VDHRRDVEFGIVAGESAFEVSERERLVIPGADERGVPAYPSTKSANPSP